MNIGHKSIALILLRMLVKPFNQTDAFRLGLIDDFGHQIRSPLNSEERRAYGPLERLIFAIKKILDKSGYIGKISAVATAWHVMRECIESENYDNIELVEKRLKKYLSEDYHFLEAEVELTAIMEEVAANNTTGAEVSNPDAIPKKKLKDMDKILARRKNQNPVN